MFLEQARGEEVKLSASVGAGTGYIKEGGPLVTELGTRKGPDPRGSLSGSGSDLPWVTTPVKDWNGTADTPAHSLLDPAQAHPSCLGLSAPGNLHWQAWGSQDPTWVC